MFKKCISLSLAAFLVFQLSIASAETLFSEDFDTGDWASLAVDTDLSTKTINGWAFSAKDYKNSTFKLTSDPNDLTEKSVLVAMDSNPDWHNSGISATKTLVAPINGSSSNGIVDVSYRFMTTSNFDGRNHYIKFMNGSKNIASLGFTQSDKQDGGYNVTDWIGNSINLAAYETSFGMYFNGQNPGSGKTNVLTQVNGRLPFVRLEAYVGKSVTKYIKLSLDFNTQTIKVYYSGLPIAVDATPTYTVPFADTTATALDKIQFGGAYYSYNGIYYDDIMMQTPEQAEEPAVFAISNAAYTDSGSQISVTSEATVPDDFSSATFIVAGFDADDELALIDFKPYALADLVDGKIQYSDTLDTNGKTISKVKVFLWDSFTDMTPTCESINAVKN